jgi:hypothetical protein
MQSFLRDLKLQQDHKVVTTRKTALTNVRTLVARSAQCEVVVGTDWQFTKRAREGESEHEARE